MTALTAVGLCAAVGALAALVFFFVGRSVALGRMRGLGSRLARLEKSASRTAMDRLQMIRRMGGVVYLDGLVFSSDKTVERLFGAGLRNGARANWDKALSDWTNARKEARGSEAVALDFLCGCCHMLRGRKAEARAALSAALKLAVKLKDRAGMASCRFALGNLANSEKRYRAAHSHFAASARLWKVLDDPQEETGSLVRLAEVMEKLGQDRQALEYRRQALQLLEKAGDAVGAAAQYGAIGEILAAQGDMDGARAAHEDGLHLARQAGDRLAETERLAAIGDIHLTQGSPKRALDVLERALRGFREAHKFSGEVRVLCKLAAAHRQMGEQDVALEHYERSLKLARRLGDRALQARSLEGMASGCAACGTYHRASALLHEAVELDRAVKDEVGLCNHLVSLGTALLEQREFEKSERCLNEALEIARRNGDTRTEMLGILELARGLRGQGRSAETLDLLEKCRAHARGLGDSETLARVHSEIGLNHLAAKNQERAVSELRAAVELRHKAGSIRELGHDLVNLGVALEAGADPGSGMRSIEDGLRRLHSTGVKADETWALCVLAAANRRRGDPHLARQNLARALGLSRQGGDVLQEALCLCDLGRLCAAERDPKQARSYLEQAARVYSRLGAEDKARDVVRELNRLPHSGTGVQFLDE